MTQAFDFNLRRSCASRSSRLKERGSPCRRWWVFHRVPCVHPGEALSSLSHRVHRDHHGHLCRGFRNHRSPLEPGSRASGRWRRPWWRGCLFLW